MSDPERIDLARLKSLVPQDLGLRRPMIVEVPPVPAPLVPKRFAAVRLATYVAETESERLALRAVTNWVAAVLEGGGPMLALIGPQGTGKSHLLYAASWELYAAGFATRPCAWYILADQLRYGDGKAEAFEIRARIHEMTALLLDEVRPTANTAFDDTELAKLACHYYDREAPMLLTTNVSPLELVLGPAAASRFMQVTVVGRDRRQAF